MLYLLYGKGNNLNNIYGNKALLHYSRGYENLRGMWDNFQSLK